MVDLIDQTALAAAYGTTLDADDKAQAKQRKKDDAKKKALVAALHTKVVQRFALRSCPATLEHPHSGRNVYCGS